MNLGRRQAVRAISEFLDAIAKELNVLADAEAAALPKRPAGSRQSGDRSKDAHERLSDAANIISDAAAELNDLLE
jgi:hypothetical protein